MEMYLFVKLTHIITSTVLFGTGIGIAFFMFRSWFSKDPKVKLFAAQNTVIADYFFTLPAVIIQPVTGIALIHIAGFNPMDFWLKATYLIYIIAGICWIPVVWIQIQLKKMCQQAVQNNTPLPYRYDQLFKCWFILGWPAFIGLIVIFYLMVAKPI